MGTGASTAKPKAPSKSEEIGLKDVVIDAAKGGNQECQDMFFEQMNRFAASGNSDGLRKLISAWKGCTNKHGAKEATCVAAKHDQAECLKVLLDEGIRPFIGRNDPEVNPLIHAVELQSWDCIECLVPRALKYNFSTGLLQQGMLDFVIKGNKDMISKCMLLYKIPGNAKLLCAALLVGPGKCVQDMTGEMVEHIKDLNEISTLEPTEEFHGWEEFAPIHAASKASKSALQPSLMEFLLEQDVDLSTWGKELSLKTNFAKRLPLHYAASNKNMPQELVERMAKAYPDALFSHVNDKPGRDLPCQCAKHDEGLRLMLEKLMYQYVCDTFDALEKDSGGEYMRLIRMALLFEKVRTLNESQLSRGKLSFVVTSLMQKKMDNSSDSAESSDFSMEAARFAEANPRVNLGKTGGAKIAMKSISNIGSHLKSDFWEILKLANHCSEATPEIPHFEEMLDQEIQSRLKWVALSVDGKTGKDVPRSDVIRYGMFVLAGLIGDIIGTQSTEGGEGEASPDKGAAVLSAVVKNVPREYLEAIVAAYTEELHLPTAWNLLQLLQEGLMGAGIKQIVFSGGDLVIKRDIPPASPTFVWVEGLFENTFLKRYTRDRRGGKVPESLQLQEVEQVLNCGSWGEYAKRRRQVYGQLTEKGAAWMGDLRTDACTKGEAADWYRNEELPEGVNEHWLYHGTSLEGETGITEGDFRLNLAGSNAGTLYGNGVYLAEAVSKSDEYTSTHGSSGFRTILLCLSCLGRVNYNDERRPDGDELAASCKDQGGFHSILGDREKIRGTYREIVLFDEDLIYPGYICRYIRVE